MRAQEVRTSIPQAAREKSERHHGSQVRNKGGEASEIRDARRGLRALSVGWTDQMPPLPPSNRCLFQGPPLPSLGPRPSPHPPKILPPLRIGPRPAGGRGPRALTSPVEGGGRLGEGGDGPRLSTLESSLPGLVLLRNRSRGREPGGRASGAAAGGWPWRDPGAPAVRGLSRDPARGPGRRSGSGAPGGGSSGRASGWKRALSRPPWLWGCPPRKRLPAMWLWSVGT